MMGLIPEWSKVVARCGVQLQVAMARFTVGSITQEQYLDIADRLESEVVEAIRKGK